MLKVFSESNAESFCSRSIVDKNANDAMSRADRQGVCPGANGGQGFSEQE